jgi:uncharacterized protein (DUF58 family)
MKASAALKERFAAWALRTRPPEAAPIVLSRRRVYVLPTRAGLAFAVALLVMLLGAINYNLSLGHALVFLLAGLGIVAILQTFRNLAGIVIEPGRVEPVFAGEIAHFVLALHNPRDQERRLIRVTLPGGSDDSADVAPGGVARARVGLLAPRRGWLALPRITLATDYPLGLIRAWAYAAPDMHCLVYPQPADPAPPLPAGSAEAGAGLLGASGSEDFAGLRAHQAADPPRHVAWKAAARLGAAAPLQTKLFAGASVGQLWLDWDAVPANDVEARLAILARWVLEAAELGLAWGLRLPGVALTPDRGASHLHACLKALALHDRR